jgi:dual specificity MAP kinase phosphatase
VSDPPIYAITSEALSQAYAHLASQPLPATQQVFPWLHGLHPDNYFQLGFFGARRASHRRTPSCLRTMTVVKTGGDLSHSKLKGAIAPEEILKVSDGPIGPDDDGPVFTPDFLDNDPREGFGVRNFQIQTAKLATVSDIVVYADPSATQTEIVSVAMTISQAQERWANRLDRSESETMRQFNTFILIGKWLDALVFSLLLMRFQMTSPHFKSDVLILLPLDQTDA